jgi:hypothetical protein
VGTKRQLNGEEKTGREDAQRFDISPGHAPVPTKTSQFHAQHNNVHYCPVLFQPDGNQNHPSNHLEDGFLKSVMFWQTCTEATPYPIYSSVTWRLERLYMLVKKETSENTTNYKTTYP